MHGAWSHVGWVGAVLLHAEMVASSFQQARTMLLPDPRFLMTIRPTGWRRESQGQFMRIPWLARPGTIAIGLFVAVRGVPHEESHAACMKCRVLGCGVRAVR